MKTTTAPWALIVVLVNLLLMIVSVTATPILFDKLFGLGGSYPNQNNYGGYGYSGYQPTKRSRPATRGGRTYKEICRTLNPTQNVLPGRPGVPVQSFCPY
jgi:hypothetical protein